MTRIPSALWSLFFVYLSAQVLYATATTQIWIPSTDVQAFKSIHFGLDNYFTLFTKAGQGGYMFPTDLGLTVGGFPGLEFGVDLCEHSDYPLSGNAKFALPEGWLGLYSPALAIGGFGFGTQNDVTDNNILYALMAKTIAPLGRLSVGYYVGNERVLVTPKGQKDNAGWLASYDRSLPEVSDRLWFGMDYQEGQNIFGAFSSGFAWKFTDQVSLLFGYIIYNRPDVKGTVTTQLDINF